MIIHDTVSIIVKKGDRFLLTKRGHRPETNCWGVPGGHVDAGEKPFQAAAREAKEEAGGVSIISRKPVYVYVHDADIGHRHKDYVFLGRVAGKVKAGTDAKRLGWFTINQMKKMNITHYTKLMINKLYSREV